jgi:hypothetical protein
MEKIDSNHTIRRIPFVGGEPFPGTLVEMVYRPEKSETAFAIYEDSKVRYEPTFPAGVNEAFVPYTAQNTLVRNRIILLPSATDEYGNTAALVQEIRAFIHRYVTVSPLFETIAAHYVLLTWIYESFGTLPYLRARGDFGSGKTRFLTAIGSLCFRAIFAGTSTVSPLFRMLHIFRGTLVIDEGDFRVSDEKAEMIKILNNGNAKGFPVLRSEQSGNGKEFNPVAYDVFGPKVMATRGYYHDPALESRFISEDMAKNRPRPDTPLHLPESFSNEAERLRNKLLMFRFRNLKRYSITQATEGTLEPRISQIFAPLLSLVADEKERNEILDLIRDYSNELSLDRSINIETHVVEIIKELWTGGALTLKAITSRLNEKYREEFQEMVSGKRVGFVVRKLLNLQTRKRAGVFEIVPTEQERIESLFRRFGLESEEVSA